SIKATTDVTVETVALHRETGDGHAGDSPDAAKAWVKVKIVIAPDATNEVGHPHTFTATISTDSGSGYQHVGAGVDCNITLTNSNGAVATPPGPLNTTTDANGQCSITFTSNTPGKVMGIASSTFSIGGQSVTVTTNATGDNSGPAVKSFVDANIQISPQTATNPTSTNHVLTGHVNVIGSDGVSVPAPAGTTINFSLTNS